MKPLPKIQMRKGFPRLYASEQGHGLQAAGMMQRRCLNASLEAGLSATVSATGVDRAVADLLIPGPMRDQAPTQQHQFPLPVVAAPDHGHDVSWRNIVAGRKIRSVVGKPVEIMEFASAVPVGETTAHPAPRAG